MKDVPHGDSVTRVGEILYSQTRKAGAPRPPRLPLSDPAGREGSVVVGRFGGEEEHRGRNEIGKTITPRRERRAILGPCRHRRSNKAPTTSARSAEPARWSSPCPSVARGSFEPPGAVPRPSR